MRQGQPEAAVAAYTRCLLAHPNQSIAHAASVVSNRALALLRLGRAVRLFCLFVNVPSFIECTTLPVELTRTTPYFFSTAYPPC